MGQRYRDKIYLEASKRATVLRHECEAVLSGKALDQLPEGEVASAVVRRLSGQCGLLPSSARLYGVPART